MFLCNIWLHWWVGAIVTHVTAQFNSFVSSSHWDSVCFVVVVSWKQMLTTSRTDQNVEKLLKWWKIIVNWFFGRLKKKWHEQRQCEIHSEWRSEWEDGLCQIGNEACPQVKNEKIYLLTLFSKTVKELIFWWEGLWLVMRLGQNLKEWQNCKCQNHVKLLCENQRNQLLCFPPK